MLKTLYLGNSTNILSSFEITREFIMGRNRSHTIKDDFNCDNIQAIYMHTKESSKTRTNIIQTLVTSQNAVLKIQLTSTKEIIAILAK